MNRIPRSVSLVALLAFALVAALFVIQGCAGSGETVDQTTDVDTPVDPVPPMEEDQLYTPAYEPTGDEIAVISVARTEEDGSLVDLGEVRIEFYPEDAPNHVAAFIELANKEFYDGTKFHRVEPGFVVQGGDPLSRTDDPRVGTGGPGYRLKAEFNDRQHLDGTVAMARSQDPDSGGSQFYICLGPQPFLDGQYTVFGQVVDGMDIVRQIQVGDVMQFVRIENQ